MADPTFEAVALAFSAFANGLKALKELVTGNPRAQAQVAELYDIVLSSQSRAVEAYAKETAMIERIRDLEEEVRRLRAWRSEKERYCLSKPWDNASFLVYALKESRKDSEPAHWICTRCYADGERSILQPKKEARGYLLLACPVCRFETHTGMMALPAPTYGPC